MGALFGGGDNQKKMQAQMQEQQDKQQEMLNRERTQQERARDQTRRQQIQAMRGRWGGNNTSDTDTDETDPIFSNSGKSSNMNENSGSSPFDDPILSKFSNSSSGTLFSLLTGRLSNFL